MATTTDIPLEDGRALRVVQQVAADKPGDLAQALALTGVGAVVVLAGGDDEPVAALKPRLIQLLSRGLLRAVREAQALCIARAGASGLAGMLGRAAADAEISVALLGVGPAARLVVPGQARDGDDAREPTAPGLTHLLLTPGADWGSEMRIKIDVAQALAAGTSALMVVIGGSAAVAAEVLHAVRRRWAVLVVKGSGGAADELARQWADRAADNDDPVVAEILADGNLTCITLGERVGEAVETMARQVLRDSGGDSVLRQAWRRFAAIDAAAVRQQSSFMTVQMRILALGLVAVFLAIVQTLLKDNPSIAWLHGGLGVVLIVVPIGTSVLIAVTNRFKPGKRWVLLRSAAESIKREIYRYRLRAEGYAAEATREKNLAKAVEDITRRLARTEANTTALPVYTGPIPPRFAASPGDDGMSFLTTDQYVRLRLDDQLRFYRRKTVTLESEFSRLQIWVLLAGAAGTLLAALGGSAVIWIALTTALAGAFMTHQSYRQVESTLVGYNQTATDLENILAWWTSLKPEEQARPVNIEALSSYTEQVLASELAGWSQRMTDALEKLREAQEPEPHGGDEGDAKEPAPTAGRQAAVADAKILQSDHGEVAHNAAGTRDAQAGEATTAAPETSDAGEPLALDKPADKKT